MKEKLVLTSYEKQLLNQRNLIETVFDCLKHQYHVWHTRHRSMAGFDMTDTDSNNDDVCVFNPLLRDSQRYRN